MSKTPTEAFQCVKVEAMPRTISFMAMNANYNLGMATIAHGNVDGEEDEVGCSMYFRGDVLSKVIASCRGDVQLDLNGKFMHVTYDGGSFKIPCVSPDTIPEVPKFTPTHWCECDSKSLKKMLSIAAAVDGDCQTCLDPDGTLMLAGGRGDSFVALTKLAGPGECSNPPVCIFTTGTAGSLSSGCIGQSTRLSSDSRFICVESEEDGLSLKTVCALSAGKPVRVNLLRRLALENETLIPCLAELTSAMKRCCAVAEVESVLVDVDFLRDKVILSNETSSGSTLSECAVDSKTGDWIACVNAERAAAMLSRFSQQEPITLYNCKLGENSLALRFVQGDSELFMAQGTRVEVK